MFLYAYKYLVSKFSNQKDQILVPHTCINVSSVKSTMCITVLYSATVYFQHCVCKFDALILYIVRRDSLTSIVTRYGLNGPGFVFR